MPWKDETSGWCSGSIQIPNPNPGRVPRFNGAEWEDAPPTTLADDLAGLLQRRHPNLDVLSSLSQVGVLHRNAAGELGIATLGSLLDAPSLLGLIKSVDGLGSGLDADLVRGQVAQVHSSHLDALADLSGTGVVQKTGPTTFSVGDPIDASTLGGVGPSGYQPAHTNLTGLADIVSPGILVHTGPGAFTHRVIGGIAGQVDVVHGDGIDGEPTIGIASNPTLPGTGGVTLPSGTDQQRPSTPSPGTTRYNTDSGALEVYGTSWQTYAGTAVGSWMFAKTWNIPTNAASIFGASGFGSQQEPYFSELVAPTGMGIDLTTGGIVVEAEGAYRLQLDLVLVASPATASGSFATAIEFWVVRSGVVVPHLWRLHPIQRGTDVTYTRVTGDIVLSVAHGANLSVVAVAIPSASTVGVGIFSVGSYVSLCRLG